MEQIGSTLYLKGLGSLSKNDTVHFDQAGTIRIQDQVFHFNPAVTNHIEIDGEGTPARLIVSNHQDQTNVTVGANSARVTTPSGRDSNATLFASGFQRIDVLLDGDNTSASFQGDTNSVDHVTIKPTHAWLEADQFTGYVRGADQVDTVSTDRVDTTVLYDLSLIHI